MNFRIRYERAGGHVHMRVFVGQQRDHTHGKAGDLCMTEQEAGGFLALCEGRNQDDNGNTITCEFVPESEPVI